MTEFLPSSSQDLRVTANQIISINVSSTQSNDFLQIDERPFSIQYCNAIDIIFNIKSRWKWSSEGNWVNKKKESKERNLASTLFVDYANRFHQVKRSELEVLTPEHISFLFYFYFYIYALLKRNPKVQYLKENPRTCSEIWRQMKGSVWIKREHVFLLSSFGLVALRLLRWLGLFASLVYLWPGVSGGPFQGFTFGLSSLNFLGDGAGSGSGSSEFWTLSIHSATSLVIPQPLESPVTISNVEIN